jgi:hypothetical protein
MARKILIITDVTAMSGNNVCIAGYDDSLTCIRPVLSGGQITKRHLFRDGELIIFPGAKVAFNFGAQISQPPHVEDVIFEEASIENMGRVSVREWKEILTRTATQNVGELFTYIEDRCVPPGSPGPSIGTIMLPDMPTLNCDYYKNPPRPKIRFVDQGGIVNNNVPITDLAFRNLFDFYLAKYKGDCEKTVKLLNNKLADHDIYLRLGLSRSFRGCCWLQVNGIHTFPDLYDRDYGEWIQLD